MEQPKYFFSPTLLDGFCDYLAADANWDKFYGQSDEPSISIAEYEEKCYLELIDKINRVPFVSEAASKGTAFNDIIDTLIHNKVCGRTKFEKLSSGSIVYGIRTMIDGFTFEFEFDFLREAAEYFGRGSNNPSDRCLSQVLTSANIQTRYGVVNLYGFIDELRRDIVYDIKTTSRYEFLKYQDYNQRYVYPYCLIESGMLDNVRCFEFTAFQLTKPTTYTPLIKGVMNREVYGYDHKYATEYLRSLCERFIEFIETNRNKITDTNIFTEHQHNH